jgi:hypothetical protein
MKNAICLNSMNVEIIIIPYPHYLVLTQPIAGGPEAVGFARVSPKPWRAKG